MFENTKKIIEKELNTFLDTELASVLEHSPKALYYAINDFVKRPGKRIRPFLFILAYKGYSKEKGFAIKKDILKCALSFELLHDFFLVHDDIIDNSALRRGKPTLHRVLNKYFGLPPEETFGANLGIITGDILFALSLELFFALRKPVAFKEKAFKILLRSAIKTGTGEFMDVINDLRKMDKTINEKKIMLAYTLKTASYTFEGPILSGAALCGAKEKEMQKLSRLSVALGQAFQIYDDMIDIFLSPHKTGKPAMRDLAESKITLLVWRTYMKLSPDDKKVFCSLFKKDKKSVSDLKKIKSIIQSTSSAEYCARKASLLLEEALRLCDALEMKLPYRDILRGLIVDLKNRVSVLG